MRCIGLLVCWALPLMVEGVFNATRMRWVERAAAPVAYDPTLVKGFKFKAPPPPHIAMPQDCTAFKTSKHATSNKLRWAYPALAGWVEPSLAHVLNGEAAPTALPCSFYNEDPYTMVALATEAMKASDDPSLKRSQGNRGEIVVELPADGAYRKLLPWMPPRLTYFPRESLHYIMPLIDRYWTSQTRADRDVMAGTFVELGAYDGSTMANSRVLERNFGWSGVLIEGQRKFCSGIRSIRRGAHLFCPAAVGHAYSRTSIGMSDTGTRGAMTEAGASVPLRTMGSLLLEAGVERVDFFSIDVEGAELGVLETMDWNLPVHVVFIEMRGEDHTKDMACRWLLKQKGFVLVHDGGDQIWENPSFEDQVKSTGARVGLFPRKPPPSPPSTSPPPPSPPPPGLFGRLFG